MKTASRWIKGLCILILFIGIVGFSGLLLGSKGMVGVSLAQDIVPDEPIAPSEPTANPETPSPASSGPQKDVDVGAKFLETVSVASTYVNNIFNPLIHFLTFQIGTFLGNDYIFAGAMGEMLHTVWVITRNIVNIIFVLILLVLAIKHIFQGEDADIAKTLPKFVIYLVAINFSWLAGKLVLDAANVATNVVFAVPSGIQGVAGETLTQKLESKPCKVDENKPGEGCSVPSNIFMPADAVETWNFDEKDCNDDFLKGMRENYQKAYPPQGSANPNAPMAKTAVICWQTIKLENYNQNSASYYLTYAMARVQNLTRANTGKASFTQGLSRLAIGTLFSFLLQIVYLIAFGALYVALIFRVAFLWIIMAFSPVIVLFLFSESAGLGNFGGEAVGKYLSVKALVKWAFAPAQVGAVWTVGFIMVTAGQTIAPDFWQRLNANEGVDANIFSVSSLFFGMDSIQQFIWLLMTTGILWMGTFAILGELDVVGSALQKVGNYGSDLVSKLAAVPTWAPIIPSTDGKGGFERKSFGRYDLSKKLDRMRMQSEGINAANVGHIEQAEEKLKANIKVFLNNVNYDNPPEVFKKFLEVTDLKSETISEHTKEVTQMIEKHQSTLGPEKTNQLIKIVADQAKLNPRTASVPLPVTPPAGDGHGHAATPSGGSQPPELGPSSPPTPESGH